MTEKTGLFRRLEALERLMVAANAEFGVAVATDAAYTVKRIDNDFFESI